MPKFLEIYRYLREKIRSLEYKAGETLPSEHELTEEFGVSRGTIRKALALLEEKGFIQKRKGKGSVVLDVQRFDLPLSGLTSYKELQLNQGNESKTLILENKTTFLPPDVAKFLHLSFDEEAIFLKRLRKVKNEGVILDIDYLLASIIPEIPYSAAENSLYEYIEGTLRLPISYARKEFTVEPVTEEDKKLLSLQGDTHVVVTRSAVFLEDTRLFQYSESRHRVDTFRFTDFARRRTPAMP